MDDLIERLAKIYTGAIVDSLDDLGVTEFVVLAGLRPTYVGARTAGLLYPVRGEAVHEVIEDRERAKEASTQDIFDFLEGIGPGSVPFLSGGAGTDCALWGELMSTAARAHGAVGVVVDGPVRDTPLIEDVHFPTFARSITPLGSFGRWHMTERSVEIDVPGGTVRPGDLVVADADGVVVFPSEVGRDLLVLAEEVTSSEGDMRAELRDGLTLREAYAKYGRL